MNVIVIMQNLKDSIEPMQKALVESGFNYVFVLDRCDDGSHEECLRLKAKHIVTPWEWTGRKTSSARNYGYSYMKTRYGLQDTLFIDGDRTPLGSLRSIENFETDILLFKLENDFRDDRNSPVDRVYGGVYNSFFSCGIVFKKDALLKIENFYKERPEYGHSTIFPENVEHFWGIEDTLLGDICFHLKLSCGEAESPRLKGAFERNELDSLDVLELRFNLRDKLDVLW